MKKTIKLVYLFIFSFITITVILISVSTFFSFEKYKRFMMEDLRAYGLQLSSDIAFMSGDILLSEEYASLKSIISEFDNRKGVEEIAVLNSKLITVGDRNPEHLGKPTEYDIDLISKQPVIKTDPDNKELWFSTAIEKNKVQLGRVILAVSLVETRSQIGELLAEKIWSSMLFFGMCIVCGIIVTKLVTAPVEKLVSTINESSMGIYCRLESPQWIEELSQLQSAYNALIDQIRYRKNQLESAKNEAERANSAKSIFLANISHELRTPLNGILGFATLLENTDLSTEQKDMLDKIRVSGEILSAMVRNILDLIELESGKCRVTESEFDLAALFRYIKTDTEVQLKDLPVTFSCNIEGCSKVKGDREHLEQVLFLVVNNAVKFTKKGHIELTAYWDEQLVFKLSDTGIGIPVERLEQIFEPMYQIEEPLKKIHRGIGIGLSIVRTLVELMGGSIEINSEEGKGTDVTINLPFVCCNDDFTVSDKYRGADVEGFDILLVEDDPINRMFIEKLLEKEGYSICGVSDGFKALEIFDKEKFRLVLMDIGLPGMSGIETAVAIFNSRKYVYNPVRIIPVTASDETEIRNMCAKAGMIGFVSKPVRKEQLLFIIENEIA